MALQAATGRDILERMVNAVERVRERLIRAASALGAGRVPYAVVGDGAVAAWVATIDEAAVRNTRDVDVLIRRSDFTAAHDALRGAGFVYRKSAGIDLFLDSDRASPRDAVHVIFADEYVRPGELAPNPRVDESIDLGPFRVIGLDALVRIKLTAYRDKDRTHLRDLIDVCLVDQSWTAPGTARVPPALAPRLQAILDTPLG